MGYYSTMRPIVKKNLVWGMLTGRVTGMGLPAPRKALIKSLSDFILGILCNARNNSTRIARESYDEAVHKNPYEIWLCELISASLAVSFQESWPAYGMNSILEHGAESAAGGSVFLAARS